MIRTQPVPRRQVLESYHHSDASKSTWTIVYLILAFISLGLYIAFKYEWIGSLGAHRSWTLRLSFAIFLGFLVLGFCRWLEFHLRKNAQTPASRYNLIRFLRLLAGLFTITMMATAVFQNWYTAAMSLGLISVVFGFALQVPVTSFVGWVYIVFRNPFKVGDRILIDQFKGEVFDIGYLDTGLREFSGHRLSADVPTGRMVRFPNNLVLRSAIVNYRWNQFPLRWDETDIYIKYDSDLNLVESMLRQITLDVLGPEMAKEVEELKNIPSVRSEDFDSYPFVNIVVEEKGRIKMTLLYLVEPRKTSAFRNILLKEIYQKFREQEMLEVFHVKE